MRFLVFIFSFLALQASAQQLGRVYQSVDSACNWTTYRADGTLLSTAATLQDGVNEAQESGYPLIVDGRIGCPITAPVTFGPSLFQSYVLRNVSQQYSGPYAAVTIDALYGSTIDWQGAIQYSGNSAIILITPRHVVSGFETYPIIEFSNISLPFIYASGGFPFAAVLFDPTYGAIINNTLRFAGIFGGGFTTNGIVMFNPLNALNGLAQNMIDFNVIAGFTSTGIQEGNGNIDPSTQPLGTNIWRGAITTDGTVYSAYMTFGVMSQAYLSSISINSGTLQYGVAFFGSAHGNLVAAPQLMGAQPCFRNGVAGNKCMTAPF